MRSVAILCVPVLLTLLAGCGKQGGPVVYVLESRQQVELKASASALQVKPGEQVVLHVEQHTTGQWKKVGRGELQPGQCWVYRPPVEVEEVAHSVQWEVVPENSVEFHQEYQLDKTRIATVHAAGKVTLTPLTDKVKCEEGRVISGNTIEIEVAS